jgi:hypothetical protein
VERLARGPAGPRSAFDAALPDLGETEARLLLALVQSARQRMLLTLDHLGLARPQAKLSARWNVMTTLRYADIALSELNVSGMRGYGGIDTGSAAEVMAAATELRELIGHGRELLQSDHEAGLRDRLAHLEGPAGEVLRLAESLSTEVGAVEVRALVAAAAERVAAGTVDIGVFGRVSSGKSSLINALITAPLLPVGATSVTAVPIRVGHGPDAIDVTHADGRRERIDAAALRAFATEEENPDNTRRVESIEIHTPHVAEGLVLLDTPGIGSLSRSGPAQAFAWLPRCDLGIVLVAAGTPLGRDELALVSGLAHAGIAVEVLLSKSDLLAPRERSAAVAYVRTEMARATGIGDVRVRVVSVVPSDVALLDRWRDDELAPLVGARQRAAAASLGRRLRAILHAMRVAMAERPTVDTWKLELQRARAEAEREVRAAADDVEEAARDALARTSEAVAEAWRDGEDARAAAQRTLLDAPNRALDRVRLAADRLLDGSHGGPEGDAVARLPPLFDPPLVDELPIAPSPGIVDRMFTHSSARRQLAPLARALDDALGTYANRLRAWGLQRIEEHVERVASARAGTRAAEDSDPAHFPPILRPLAALIDRHFPAPYRDVADSR